MKPLLGLLALTCSIAQANTEAILRFIAERPELRQAVDMPCLVKLDKVQDIMTALPAYALTLGAPRLGDLLLDYDHRVLAVRPRSSASKAQIEIGDTLLNPAPKPKCALHEQYPALQRQQSNESLWLKASGQKRQVWQGEAEVTLANKHFLIKRREDPEEKEPVLQFTSAIPIALKDWSIPENAQALIIDLREAQWYEDPLYPALQEKLTTKLPIALIVGPWTAGQAWQLVLDMPKAILIADKSKQAINPCLRYHLHDAPPVSERLYECVAWLPNLLSNDWRMAKPHPKNPNHSLIFIEASEALKAKPPKAL